MTTNQEVACSNHAGCTIIINTLETLYPASFLDGAHLQRIGPEIQRKMPKPNPTHARTISCRISPEEYARFTLIADKAIKKHKCNKTPILRELLGLDKNVLLSDADIRYFRTGKK